MGGLIGDFHALREARREARLYAMDGFLSTFEATHRRVWHGRLRAEFDGLPGRKFNH